MNPYNCTTCAYGDECEGECIGWRPDPRLDDGDYDEDEEDDE